MITDVKNSDKKSPVRPEHDKSNSSTKISEQSRVADRDRGDRQSVGASALDTLQPKRRLNAKDVFVLFAMFLVVLAISAALRFELNLNFVSAISIGISFFLMMIVGHGLFRLWILDFGVGRTKQAPGITGDTLLDWQQRLVRVDELTTQLKELENVLGESSLKEAFEARDNRQQKLIEEMSRIEQLLVELRKDFHQTSEEQRQFVRSELQLVETLVKQITENLSDGSRSLNPGAQQRNETSTGPINSSSPPKTLPASEIQGVSEEPGSRIPHSGDGGQPSGSGLLEMVRESIESNKIDLYLQPIVILPNRKVRYYEVLTRLRNASEQTMLPVNYIPVAEQAGLMPLIDNVMLFRSVQIMSRLADREPARGLFCNISPHSLLDGEFFPDFIEFMEQHVAYAGALFFEFSQSMIKQSSAVELEGLATLSGLGFRFSMDNVTDLDIDFSELQARGFRFIKVDASVILHGMAEVGSRIHAADLKSYLQRYGIVLIVQKIEGDQQLSELLEFGVQFGQGFLFAEPRPVRPEIFGIMRKVNNADKAA